MPPRGEAAGDTSLTLRPPRTPGAKSEAFAGALHDGLVSAAAWLARQHGTVFKELRAAGRVTDVFVDGWMTQSQFNLELPPEFLIACGALGLTLSVCTND